MIWTGGPIPTTEPPSCPPHEPKGGSWYFYYMRTRCANKKAKQFFFSDFKFTTAVDLSKCFFNSYQITAFISHVGIFN